MVACLQLIFLCFFLLVTFFLLLSSSRRLYSMLFDVHEIRLMIVSRMSYMIHIPFDLMKSCNESDDEDDCDDDDDNDDDGGFLRYVCLTLLYAMTCDEMRQMPIYICMYAFHELVHHNNIFIITSMLSGKIISIRKTIETSLPDTLTSTFLIYPLHSRQCHPLWNRLPLLRIRIQPLRLCLLPLLPHNARPLLTPRRNSAFERLRHAHEPLGQLLRVRQNRVPHLINLRTDIKRPQHPRDAQEQTPLRDVDALTDTPPRAEGEVVPLGDVRVTCGVVGGLVIVLVSIGVEDAGVRVPVLVHVDGPDVVHDPRARGDAVAHVVVVPVSGEGVRDRAEDGGWHPPQRLLHAAADVLQVWLVVHGGQALIAHDGVDLRLCALLDFGEQDHGLDEAVESAGGRVGASFQ